VADFEKGLPKGFVLAKPIAQENYDESVIYQMEREGRLVITRKRDGWKLLAHFDATGKIRLYTDGINEIDSRLDHIKEELSELGLSPNTLVVGEAIVDEGDNDDLTKVISVFQSNLDKAQVLQKQHGRIRFMVFAGIDLLNSDNSSGSLSHSCFHRIYQLKGRYIFRVPILLTAFDQAKKIVVEKGWEGLVLYEESYVLTYRADGKNPKRPQGCYKWKPIMEDDFIVREFVPRPDSTVKELVLVQIDPATGEEFYCGKLGSFSDNLRRELAGMRYPIVVQARFDTRYPKTGKIRNARFMRVRDDKKTSACVAPRHYSSEPKEQGGENG